MWGDIALELQIFLSRRKAALALPILDPTSASMLSCLSVILPSYVNGATSSRSILSGVTGSLLVALILRTLYGFMLKNFEAKLRRGGCRSHGLVLHLFMDVG